MESGVVVVKLAPHSRLKGDEKASSNTNLPSKMDTISISSNTTSHADTKVLTFAADKKKPSKKNNKSKSSSKSNKTSKEQNSTVAVRHGAPIRLDGRIRNFIESIRCHFSLTRNRTTPPPQSTTRTRNSKNISNKQSKRQSTTSNASSCVSSIHANSISCNLPVNLKNYQKDDRTERLICQLCCAECSLDDRGDGTLFMYKIDTCEHSFCVDCLRQYLKYQIVESRVSISCPQCSEKMHPNDIYGLLSAKMIVRDDDAEPERTICSTLVVDSQEKADEQQKTWLGLIDKYEEFMLRRVLVTIPDIRYCPAPDCSYAVIASGCANCPQLNCQRENCNTSFCYHCKQYWHPNLTCEDAAIRSLTSSSGLFGAAASTSGSGAGTASTNNLIRSFLQRTNSHISISSLNNSGIVTTGNRNQASNTLITGIDSIAKDEIKRCPKCQALIVKMDDGSCNHITCAVCGCEFCWLCMKEISDLHYLSPSGCTFWGKKPWSRKKKILWQLGTLIGAPVGIALVAGLAVPAIIIGMPIWAGRKVYVRYKNIGKHKRNLIVVGTVVGSVIVAPFVAALAVGIGVPILLAYVYGVVPISLCRSGGCGVTKNNNGGVRFAFDDENTESLNFFNNQQTVMSTNNPTSAPNSNDTNNNNNNSSSSSSSGANHVSPLLSSSSSKSTNKLTIKQEKSSKMHVAPNEYLNSSSVTTPISAIDITPRPSDSTLVRKTILNREGQSNPQNLPTSHLDDHNTTAKKSVTINTNNTQINSAQQTTPVLVTITMAKKSPMPSSLNTNAIGGASKSKSKKNSSSSSSKKPKINRKKQHSNANNKMKFASSTCGSVEVVSSPRKDKKNKTDRAANSSNLVASASDNEKKTLNECPYEIAGNAMTHLVTIGKDQLTSSIINVHASNLNDTSILSDASTSAVSVSSSNQLLAETKTNMRVKKQRIHSSNSHKKAFKFSKLSAETDTQSRNSQSRQHKRYLTKKQLNDPSIGETSIGAFTSTSLSIYSDEDDNDDIDDDDNESDDDNITEDDENEDEIGGESEDEDVLSKIQFSNEDRLDRQSTSNKAVLSQSSISNKCSFETLSIRNDDKLRDTKSISENKSFKSLNMEPVHVTRVDQSVTRVINHTKSNENANNRNKIDTKSTTMSANSYTNYDSYSVSMKSEKSINPSVVALAGSIKDNQSVDNLSSEYSTSNTLQI